MRSTALGREVVERGYRAFKTNIVVPGRRAARPDAGLRPGRRHRPQPDPRAGRALTALLEAFEEGTERSSAADRRPQLQPHDRGDRPGRPGARAVRPRVARGRRATTRPRSPTRARARPSRSARARTSTRVRGFRPYLEAGAMDVASVDVIWNGFAQSLQDRRPRRDARGRLRAAQLLQPPRDVHRGAVVRRDPERADARGRRRRRALARGADDRRARDRDGELVVPSGPGWGCDVVEDVLAAHPAG